MPTEFAAVVPPTIREPVKLSVAATVPAMFSISPTYKFLATPKPPAVVTDPVLVLVEFVVLVTTAVAVLMVPPAYTLPPPIPTEVDWATPPIMREPVNALVAATVPPMFSTPEIPTPPSATMHPDSGPLLAVVDSTTRVLPMWTCLATPKPPNRTNEPVLVLVESAVPEIDMEGVLNTPPTYRFPPPTPTDIVVLVPPPTINVPVVLDVAAINPDTNSVPPIFAAPLMPIPPKDTIDPVLVLVLMTVDSAVMTPPACI
jgi:hypothetical protein